jgi:hypothetical protein
MRYTTHDLERGTLVKEKNNSKEKDPFRGSFSVIGTCGEVFSEPDLSLPERE